MIERAYYVWVNSFTPAQRKECGLLYNGDFDLDPSSWGFGWHIRASHTALITREYSYGDDDSKSLHLRFDRHRGRFNGLYQTLFLNPGMYQLTGKVRTDNLDTKGGLKWIARCLLPRERVWGKADAFWVPANGETSDLNSRFPLPAPCRNCG